jgi:hypothetical protein
MITEPKYQMIPYQREDRTSGKTATFTSASISIPASRSLNLRPCTKNCPYGNSYICSMTAL